MGGSLERGKPFTVVPIRGKGGSLLSCGHQGGFLQLKPMSLMVQVGDDGRIPSCGGMGDYINKLWSMHAYNRIFHDEKE